AVASTVAAVLLASAAVTIALVAPPVETFVPRPDAEALPPYADGQGDGDENGGEGAGGGTSGGAEQPAPDAEGPTLDEGRAQFELLVSSALAAAGDDAVWSADPPLAVAEYPCDGGVMLRIEGEFTTGGITDTTTDEHDREVTATNVAAADRIAAAWHAVGLGKPGRIHDEPVLGPGELGAVESATVDFDFGVAKPRVDGRCLIAG
ncbi:MAG TPA: hypothetical protein VGE78_04080, partial [Agromyces sp.]